MATLDKIAIAAALTRLGELADRAGGAVELLLVGGGVMVLEFDARPSTRDLDVVVLAPQDLSYVRNLAHTVAVERGWSDDWLNDAVKGFMVGPATLTPLLSLRGIRVSRPSIEQLLAMKLSAWRDDVDVADARRLLQELSGTRENVWSRVEPHLQLGRELKAKYAFEDLWEELHGNP